MIHLDVASGLLVVIGAALGGDEMPAPQPVRLITQQDAAGLAILVQGESDIDCEVRYELHIESGVKANRNHTVQRGRARLFPGEEILLSRSALRNAPADQWKARLIVQSCRGYQYELSAGPAQAVALP